MKPSHLLKLDANQSQANGALKLLWQQQLRFYYTMATKIALISSSCILSMHIFIFPIVADQHIYI